jgi:surface antigen
MATITVQQAIQYAKNAGFTGQPLVDIVSIAWAESNFNTTVVNSIGATGVLQILLSAHPDVTSAQAKDPQFSFNYAYKLSNGGKNFCAWQSYKTSCGKGYDNRYAQYVPQVQAQVNLSGGSSSSSVPSTVKSGDGNNYPPGQCTWWADERYHQLTGYYNPWNHTGQANAYQWLGQAKAYGWQTASTPPKGVPSIICLQGNAGQGVESTLGHVAVVEKVNSDGSVVTSNMNFNVGPSFPTSLNTQGYPVHQITFKQGPGVSFIWAGGGSLSSPNTGGGAGGSTGTTYVPLLEQVHETLVNVPGFYGIALALDEAEQYPGWVDLTSGQWDITGYIRSTGATISDNFVPFMIRSSLFSVGFIVMLLLILKVVLEVGDKAVPIIKAAV